jgi:polyketide cyclase/dehydrase/lipid transport protein
MRIRRRITIDAPAETVWGVVTDLWHAREWAPDFGDFPFISPQWPKQGSKATWRCRVGPLRFDFHLTLTESVRGKALQIVNQSIFGEGLEVYSFTMSGNTTTIFYDASDQPNVFGRLAAPFFEKKIVALIDRTIASLKTYCESRVKARSDK